MIPRALRLPTLSVVLLLCACGARAKQPEKPKPPDPKQLAMELDRDMAELGEIASRLREKCPELIAELRPLVARMRIRFDEVAKMEADPKLGVELKAEVAAYNDRAKGRSDKIGEDLAATYLACPQREELRKVIDQIPHSQ